MDFTLLKGNSVFLLKPFVDLISYSINSKHNNVNSSCNKPDFGCSKYGAISAALMSVTCNLIFLPFWEDLQQCNMLTEKL